MDSAQAKQRYKKNPQVLGEVEAFHENRKLELDQRGVAAEAKVRELHIANQRVLAQKAMDDPNANAQTKAQAAKILGL